MTDAARVLDRLRLQQSKYREMISIVSGQRSVFASLDVDGILGLIEQKRRLLEEIDGIERELAPMKGDWARVRAGFTPEEGQALEVTLDETKRVLEELVGLEDEGRALLARRQQEKSEALDGLLNKNRARGAYGAR